MTTPSKPPAEDAELVRKIDLMAEELRKPICHHSCEDPWYSCPLSEDGCADPSRIGCTCGAEHQQKHNEEKAKIIEQAASRLSALSKPQVDLSKYINAADISAGDAPHIVIEKLQRVINGSAPLIEERSSAGVDHSMDMSLITELSRDPGKPSFSKPQVRVSESALLAAKRLLVAKRYSTFHTRTVPCDEITCAEEVERLSEELT